MMYFVSDMCFDNDEVARKRHFSDVTEMNNIITRNWNKTVCNTDIVYILGGIGSFEYLSDLSGIKYIVPADDECKHMKSYLEGVSSERDDEYDHEIYSQYLKSTYGVSGISHCRKIVKKCYSGGLVRLATRYERIRDTIPMIYGGSNDEYQRLFKVGINSNIYMNGMHPISEVEVEELLGHVKDLF